MNFGFTEEQELLRAEVRKLLDEKAPLDVVRQITEDASGPGYAPELWREIADLGWLGIPVPESRGGAGLGWVDLVLLLEETGRSLFPSPLIPTTLAAHALMLAGDESQQQRLLPRLAGGSVIGTVALAEEEDIPGPEGIALEASPEGEGVRLRGEKLFVQNAGVADLFVVGFLREGRPALGLVERDQPGVDARDWTGMDLTKRQGFLQLDDVRIEPAAILPRGGTETLSALFDAGALAVAAEAVGAAEAALALTTGYAKQRIQFGRPIGSFQGVKHPLAEAYVDVESIKSLVYYAAWCLDEGHPDLAVAVSRAKAYASECLPRVGIDAVQLHGAIGYTWEYDAQLYLKRAKWMRPVFGDSAHHYERVARSGGL